MKPETYLRRSIHAMMRKEFSPIWIFHPAFILRSGVPDFLICYRGRFVALEVKTSTGILSRLQFFVLDMIKLAGGIACVVRSVDEARNILTGIK